MPAQLDDGLAGEGLAAQHPRRAWHEEDQRRDDHQDHRRNELRSHRRTNVLCNLAVVLFVIEIGTHRGRGRSSTGPSRMYKKGAIGCCVCLNASHSARVLHVYVRTLGTCVAGESSACNGLRGCCSSRTSLMLNHSIQRPAECTRGSASETASWNTYAVCTLRGRIYMNASYFYVSFFDSEFNRAGTYHTK